jgi:hypothetical protein
MKRKLPAKRKGIFIGAYVPEELKVQLRRIAKERHTSLSKVMITLLKDAVDQRKG